MRDVGGHRLLPCNNRAHWSMMRAHSTQLQFFSFSNFYGMCPSLLFSSSDIYFAKLTQWRNKPKELKLIFTKTIDTVLTFTTESNKIYVGKCTYLRQIKNIIYRRTSPAIVRAVTLIGCNGICTRHRWVNKYAYRILETKSDIKWLLGSPTRRCEDNITRLSWYISQSGRFWINIKISFGCGSKAGVGEHFWVLPQNIFVYNDIIP
jgi:hypothetical protein